MQKLLVITGPTASGKTTLALEIAKEFGGEVICADSRTIYRGMDIGTAKIKPTEMAGISHFGLDLVAPDERYSVGDFKVYAEGKIAEIAGRERLPMLVGGTGLYISAVVENYGFDGENGEKQFDVLAMMPKIPREELYERVNARVDAMIESGLVEEVKALREVYPDDAPGMTGIGYRQVAAYLRGEMSLERMTQVLKQESRKYAKRQVTWWRHHGEVQEVESVAQAKELVRAWLK